MDAICNICLCFDFFIGFEKYDAYSSKQTWNEKLITNCFVK